MKLFNMKSAPNPRRVRMFLAEKGVDIETVEIDIVAGENLKSDYLAINPRGMLPALQLDDGSIIDDSSAICRYFEETNPEPALYGDSAKSKATIECWIRRIESDGFIPAAEMLRNSSPAFENRSVPGTSNTPQIPALAERGKTRLEAFYNRLDQQLASSEFIAGDSFSAADITALCVLDFARRVGTPIPDSLENLAAWRERVAARPSAKA
ncbi:MAG: glutathione S-transferase [Rhodospirillales bacterium]